MRAGTKTYHGSPCRNCQRTEKYLSTKACVACCLVRAKAWVDKSEENKAKVRIAVRRWADNNREQMNRVTREWAKRNPGSIARKCAARRAAKLQRTPPWLTTQQKQQIDDIYRRAAEKTRRTGTEWHVDHIVPLNGKTVCGLHVPWNLRIVPKLVNLRKGNRLAEAG